MQIPFLVLKQKNVTLVKGPFPLYSFSSEKCAWGSQNGESCINSLLYQPREERVGSVCLLRAASAVMGEGSHLVPALRALLTH